MNSERVSSAIFIISFLETKNYYIMDENLYSRQIAAIGAETQKKLIKKRVFLQGLRGLGVEIAKNIIMAGPGKVDLCDPETARPRDLGSNFYLGEDSVGKPRAACCLEQLKHLNNYVEVKIVQALPSAEHLSTHYDVVCFSQCYDREYLIAVNEACRAKGCGFIHTGSLGLFGHCFVDFGNEFVVFDRDGEENKQVVVGGITQEKEGLVCTFDDKRHGFNDGDTVVFREVKGMTEVNGKQFQIKVKSQKTFTIGDTTGFSPYDVNGVAEQVKKPFAIKNRPLKEALTLPYGIGRRELEIANWAKMGKFEQSHFLLRALFEFRHQHKRLPTALCDKDLSEFTKIIKSLLEENKAIEKIEGAISVEEVPEGLIKKYCHFLTCQISPAVSFWGGIAAQQIVKHTGKFTPLNQWFHHDFDEVFVEGLRTLREDRYGDYQLLLGEQYIKNAGKVKTFLVGAGALGCEFIKMFALMGVASDGGEVTVTDDDNIEVSNLNRQFLFRKEDVGKNKSKCATARGARMNPSTNFKSIQVRVSPESEETLNEDFWNSLDFVVNAVDNVQARLMVDSKCVWYHKQLFESGTMGTKCNSQVIIPKFTQSYSDSKDPQEEGFPICTLKIFPYQIEHTIQWARDYFEGTFAEASAETQKFIANPESYLEKAQKELTKQPVVLISRLQAIIKLARASQNRTFENCISLARQSFQEIFYNQITQLTNSLPLEHKTTQGKPFWSGVKRYPKALVFDKNDPVHAQYVQAVANIYAFIFGLKPEPNPNKVAEFAACLKLPEFKPKQLKVSEDGKVDMPMQVDQDKIKGLANELLSLGKLSPINIVEFEKDDATNYHIQCVGGIANLRARNYSIGEVPNFKVKLIAGKIIPALATTTAMVVGAVGFQIIKKVLALKNETFFNSYMNLAVPLWVFSEPMPPIEHKDKAYDSVFRGPLRAVPPKYTCWDKIELAGPLTIEQLNAHFMAAYKVDLSIATVDKVCIYNKYDPNSKKNLGQTVESLYEKLGGHKFPAYKTFVAIDAIAEDENAVDCLVPLIKYKVCHK